MIKLDEQYSIKPDTYGWVLTRSEKRFPENGTPYVFEDHSYLPTLGHCLEKYLDLCLKDCDSLQEILDEIASVRALIGEICPKIYVANGKIRFKEDVEEST